MQRYRLLPNCGQLALCAAHAKGWHRAPQTSHLAPHLYVHAIPKRASVLSSC